MNLIRRKKTVDVTRFALYTQLNEKIDTNVMSRTRLKRAVHIRSLPQKV